MLGDGSDLGAVEINPATLVVNTTSTATTQTSALSLPEAVELTDGQLSLGDLTQGQWTQVSGDPEFDATIQFDSSLAGQQIILTNATDDAFGPTALLIGSDVTIEGPTGNNGVTIAGPGSSGNLRLFRVASGASLTLENLTLSGGSIVGFAGGSSAEPAAAAAAPPAWAGQSSTRGRWRSRTAP